MNEKILLIEDDAITRELTAELLTLSGYQVITANDGDEGIALAMKEPPDLILCDIEMPGIDGYTILERLMQNQRAGKIPFIFLTARCTQHEIRKGMLMGADDYLTKPLMASELLGSVETRLRKNRIMLASNPDGSGQLPWHDEADAGRFSSLIKETGKQIFYKPGEVIFTEGTPGRMFLHIGHGSVKTCRTNDTGKVCITGIYSTGALIGCDLLSDAGCNSNTAIAVERTGGTIIGKNELQLLINDHPSAAAFYLRSLSVTISKMDKRMLSIAYYGVKKRIAEALLMLNDIYGSRSGEPAVIPLPLHDLASITGMTNESSYRVIGAFEKEGLVKKDSNGHIIVHDTEKLKAVPDSMKTGSNR